MKTFFAIAALAALLSSGGASSAFAAARVVVQLQDPSTDPATGSMQIKLDQTSVKAGTIHFDVTNLSKNLVHEMIVVKASGLAASLPYDAKADRAIEARIKTLGEVSELQPSASGSLTLAMKPGSYLLICNQPGHLHGGMAARLIVTPR